MPRLLLVAPVFSYRTANYLTAARDLGVTPILASQGHKVLADFVSGIFIDEKHPVDSVVMALGSNIPDAVIATDDQTVELAAKISSRLELKANNPNAAKASKQKDIARNLLANARLPSPEFRVVDLDTNNDLQAIGIAFPVVAKPLCLSASRGVIRANNITELGISLERIKNLLHHEGMRQLALIESFIPGREFALEGLLQSGRLKVLTVFEKPDALDGPYFEETYYLSPARICERELQNIKETVAAGCRALSLEEGAVHAEVRVNNNGVHILEIASRTIGGECARLIELATGSTLETLVIQNALRLPLSTHKPSGAVGALMLPVEKSGVLRRVEGVTEARAVRYVEQVLIDVREGKMLTAWPEGGSYPGFILARAPDVEKVEHALRTSHASLKFVVSAPLNVSVY